jgi:hypothetical protein
MLKENEKYKVHKIYSNKGTKEDSSRSTLPKHKLFSIKGKYDFDGLDLREYGWKRTYALTPQQKKVLENNPHYIDSEETMLYEGPQGIAVMYLNYKTDNHDLDIVLKNYKGNDSHTLDILKSMFERELECKMNHRKFKKEVHTSDLIRKLDEN